VITSTNILLGASGNSSGTSAVNLGASNIFYANNIVFMGGRYTGTMKFQTGPTSNLVIRGVAGGDSRANLFIGDQVGISGFGYSGGSSTGNGTLDCGGATVDIRLHQLTLGAGASVASQKYGTGIGAFIFGGHNSTVDVHEVFLGCAKLNSTVATNNHVPNHTGTLTMNGGALLVNSNFFLGFSADNDIGNTQKVTGVFTLTGGTATVANLFLGYATNTTSAVMGILNLSNGTLNVSAGIVSAGVTATGIINLVGATLNMNNSAISSINLIAGSGTLQDLAELNSGARLVKTGGGTLILAGTNAYTGPTIISNGTLRLQGHLTASSVIIASNATLAGAGALGNGLTVSPGAQLQFALGSHSDRIDITGHLTLAGTLHVADAGGFDVSNHLLFTYTGALTDNGLAIGATPKPDLVYSLETNTSGQVSLRVRYTPFVTWQFQYFGCTNCPQAAPHADPLGKGMTNTNQFLAGLDPTNSASAFRATAAPASNGGFTVTWSSVGGKTYRVQFNNGDAHGGFNGVFTDINLDIADPNPDGTPGSLSFTDDFSLTGPPPARNRYYRVRLKAPE